MKTTVAKRIEFQTNYKAKHDNVVILFRDKGFYFLYNEDAETFGQILGASWKVVHTEEYTCASFSANKLDLYLPAIFRKGHRVAIFDGDL